MSCTETKFSAAIHRFRRAKKQKSPPPSETVQEKPKRKYNRKAKPVNECKTEVRRSQTDNADALTVAERLFGNEQLSGYYTINAFVRLFNMVQPDDRKELASIIESLVLNHQSTIKQQSNNQNNG